MWIIVQGDEIVFGCDRAGQKAINLRRNPSIVLSVEDEVRNAHGFQRHLVIRRRAVIEDRFDPVLMNRLARRGTRPAPAGHTRFAVSSRHQGVDRQNQRCRPVGRLSWRRRSASSVVHSVPQW